MDRIIEVKVSGSHISKDSKNAGVQGEANVTFLRITFDESWYLFAKEVIFWNAYGNNPVKIELGKDRLENIVASELIYLVPIPAEPLEYAGKLTFSIDGYLDNKKRRSMCDELEVKDSPIATDVSNAVDPTTSDLQQMQTEIEAIKGDIREAVEATEAIENMGVSSETLPTGESAFVNKTVKEGVVNLHFGLPTGAKGESGVYIGDEEPTDPEVNVWIAPNGGEYGVAGIGMDGEESLSLIEIARIVKEKYFTSTETTATLVASAWEGTTAPFTQTISVEGMTSATQGTVNVSESATDEQFRAAAYAILRKTAQGTNSITVKAYGEKPTVDIPLTVIMGG